MILEIQKPKKKILKKNTLKRVTIIQTDATDREEFLWCLAVCTDPQSAHPHWWVPIIDGRPALVGLIPISASGPHQLLLTTPRSNTAR